MSLSAPVLLDTSDLRAVSAPCQLGESPFWHPDERVLYWCDIPDRSVHRLDPVSGAAAIWHFDSEPACCAPMQGGGLLLGMRDGLWRFDPAGGPRIRLAAPSYDPRIQRFNDGKCDPQGRFWLGTLHEPKDRPAAGLYCWEHGRMTPRAGGVTTSNGLAWSVDGSTLYWADTKAHQIDALDVDAGGGLSNRRVFARFRARDELLPSEQYGGRPDGAAMDVEGCYWVAMFEGQRLVRLGPDGRVRAVLPLPVACPTMPCFGGADLKTLFITTARANRPPEELAHQPLAGCVLAVRVDVAGLPVNFARS